MEGHIWVWITWHTVLSMTFSPHNLTIIILIIYLMQFSIILLSNIETPFFQTAAPNSSANFTFLYLSQLFENNTVHKHFLVADLCPNRRFMLAIKKSISLIFELCCKKKIRSIFRLKRL